MTVSMTDVKKVRDITNAGMMDCKNALVSANGDLDEAIKILKEKGLADAKKRSDRETKEGGVYIKSQDNKIAIIMIGCETDFVSRNDIFLATKDSIIDKIISSSNDDVSAYADDIKDAIAQIKENMEIKDAKYIEVKDSEAAFTYIHGNNKIGVVTIFEIGDNKIKDDNNFKEAANNICLHIAANSPFYLTEKDVPESDIQEQKDIITKQLEESGKPANIIENIINGKISKHFSEVCLLKQKYVKDDKMTIEKYVESVSKDLNTDVKISSFIRYMVGK